MYSANTTLQNKEEDQEVEEEDAVAAVLRELDGIFKGITQKQN